MGARVGMITIGQSPRSDVVPEIQKLLGAEIDVVECGALDGASTEMVKELAPAAGDFPLVTRMRSGEEVIVGKSKIVPKVQRCVDRLQNQCDILVVLCTGHFPQLRSNRLIVTPDALLDGIVNGIHGARTIGVLVPSGDQKSHALERWKRPGGTVVVEGASPYSERDEVTPSARKLAASNPDLIVLDCMGYTSKTKDIVRKITGRPAILPRSVVARSIRELTE